MKALTIYESEDGTRYDTEAAASANDQILQDVERALQPLNFPQVRDIDFSNGDGYWQHDPETVKGVKANLIALTRPHLIEWFRTQEEVHRVDILTVHASWFGRMLDCGHPPLAKAWSRFMRIDEATAREYGQPYYAAHPDKVKGGCLNPK